MRRNKWLAVFIITVLFPFFAAADININNNYLNFFADDDSFAMVLGTSSLYTVPNASMLYGFSPALPPAFLTSHTVAKVDGIAYDLSNNTDCPVVVALAAGTNFITGIKRIHGVLLTARFELVNNPATGFAQDTMMYKYTFTNSDTVVHNVALRLELDTEIVGVDGANISINNGFSVIPQNKFWQKSLGNIPSNWWDYNTDPTITPPTLVGRGYLKNNIYGAAAVEPDIVEVTQWGLVNGSAQWTVAFVASPPGPIITDSSVVLW